MDKKLTQSQIDAAEQAAMAKVEQFIKVFVPSFELNFAESKVQAHKDAVNDIAVAVGTAVINTN